MTPETSLSMFKLKEPSLSPTNPLVSFRILKTKGKQKIEGPTVEHLFSMEFTEVHNLFRSLQSSQMSWLDKHIHYFFL